VPRPLEVFSPRNRANRPVFQGPRRTAFLRPKSPEEGPDVAGLAFHPRDAAGYSRRRCCCLAPTAGCGAWLSAECRGRSPADRRSCPQGACRARETKKGTRIPPSKRLTFGRLARAHCVRCCRPGMAFRPEPPLSPQKKHQRLFCRVPVFRRCSVTRPTASSRPDEQREITAPRGIASRPREPDRANRSAISQRRVDGVVTRR